MKRAATALAILALGLAATGAGGITAKHRKPRPVPAAPSPRSAPAIELKSWINTKPLTSADLAGRVRLIEFWTFDCVNCQNTVLAMREIDDLYRKKGLLVLGIHSPEFARERDTTALAAAVKKQGIRFPVGIDNDHRVFDAFRNKDWPALYLVDKNGSITVRHLGELHTETRAWRNLCAAIDSALAAPPSRRS